jgi:hypothetical protein
VFRDQWYIFDVVPHIMKLRQLRALIEKLSIFETMKSTFFGVVTIFSAVRLQNITARDPH